MKKSFALVIVILLGALISVSAQIMTNGGFESPDIPTGTFNIGNGTTGGWSFEGGAGLNDPLSGFASPEAPEGQQFAVLQTSGILSSFSRMIAFPSAGTFTLSFFDAGRMPGAFGNSGNLTYDVFLDDTVIFTDATTTSQPFELKTASFDAAAGNHVLKFKINSATVGVDQTAFFDAITIDGPAPCAPAPAGLVSWYRGENDVQDAIGNRHGTFSSNSFSTGKVASGFNFTGNQFVEVSDHAALDFTNAFTIELWVAPKIAGQANGQTFFVGKGNMSFVTSQSYGILFSSDRQVFLRLGNGSAIDQLGSVSALPLNIYSHVAVTYNGNEMRVYINGVLENSRATSMGALLNTAGGLVLGGADFGNGNKILTPAGLDEVSLYNRALNDAEVAAIFAAGSAGKYLPVCAPPPPNLVSWWRAENSALDFFNANNGSIVNTVAFTNGLVGRAFYFGGSSYVQAPDSTSLQITNAMTLEGWVFQENFIQGGTIVSKYATGNNRANWYLEMNGNRINFHVDGDGIPFNGVEREVRTAVGSVGPDVWTHVAATVNASNQEMKIYLNGIEAPTTLQIGGTITRIATNAEPLRIASSFSAGQNASILRFRGLIDEFSIYDRALSSNEIASIVSASVLGKCVPPTLTLQPLTNATATLSQNGFPAANTIDGLTNSSFNSWAACCGAARTIVWETVTDAGYSNGAAFVFTLFHGDPFPAPDHNLGRFRISYTTDARTNFADGLGSGGDVAANWTVFNPTSASSSTAETFTTLTDGSLLVSGGSNNRSIYTVSGAIPATGITGFRLEALTDPSLPAGGPGRQSGNGNFHLSEFTVQSIPLDSSFVFPIALSPTQTNVNVGQSVAFNVSGGQPPRLFSLVTNQSRGTINSFSGVYVAGPIANVIDTVRVTDARGSNVFATINVQPDPTPRPDLVIHSISIPATAQPGVPFELSWVVTNRGNATATAPWSDFVFASTDALAGDDEFLAGFTLNTSLSAGGFLTVTQLVTIPMEGSAGTLRIVIAGDANFVVNETSEANNVAESGVMTVPHMLAFQGSATMTEGQTLPILIQRNGVRTSALSVEIASSDASELTVPATVVIPAGSGSTTFNVSATADGAFDGTQLAILTGSAAGFVSISNSVTILDGDIPQLSLTFSTNRVIEGGLLRAVVTRQIVADTGLFISLAGGAGQLAFTGSITIPAHTNTADFVVTAVQDTAFERTNFVTMTASASGFSAASANLTVEDDDIPNLVITLDKTTVSEDAGVNATTATVTRDRVSNQSLTVALSSGNTNAARVSASVTIPGGQTSASFAISVVNNDQVDGTRTAVIGGTSLETGTGFPLRAASSATLTVTDDDGPALQLVLARTLVGEGLSPATTATVSRNDGTNGTLSVAIVSSDLSEATVANNVVIPAGTNAVTFPIASLNDNTNDGNQTVTISATANNYAPAFANLVVSDADLPDLLLTQLTAPTNALTGAMVDVLFRVENQGLSAASAGFVQRILISTDSLVGNDELLAQSTFNNLLAVNSFFGQTLRVRMPATPGQYWIVVQTDANGAVAETLENNNTRLSVLPVVVEKAYSATVVANIETAPAGTTVVLSGHATNTGDGSAAALRLVNVHLNLRGTKRILSALTDGSGNYAVSFIPLPGEAGFYTVGADHPGVSETATQDSFTLLGLKARSFPVSRLREGGSVTNVIELDNLSNVALTELAAISLLGPSNGISLSLELGDNALAGDATVPLTAIITAPSGINGSGFFRVRVSSAEGALTEFEIPFVVEALLPRLTVTPVSLNAGMKRGGQTSVEFAITNTGGATSGPLSILAPALPWLTVSSGAIRPALAPGEGTTVTLLLTPPVDLPLGDHTGSIAINAVNSSANVPFTFRALSDNFGKLRVTAVDELTFYAEGSPVLTNATVKLTDAVSGVEILRTNFNGATELFLTNLVESFYHIAVEAPDHAPFHDTLLIVPEQTNSVRAFLSRQTVKYTFTVVPIELEDRYEVIIETTFETSVPIPVVTVEPTIFDLSDFPGETKQVNVRITNHGLLAARRLNFNFDTHALVAIEPLISDIGDLAAQSSLTIPVTLRKLNPASLRTTRADGPPDPNCTLGGRLEWSVDCGGQQITTAIPLKGINLNAFGVECGTSAQRFATELGGNPFSGGSSCTTCEIGNPGYSVPISFAKQSVCDPCVLDILGGLLENCVPLIPMPSLPEPLNDIFDELFPDAIFDDNPEPECGDGSAPAEQFINCMVQAQGDLQDGLDAANEQLEELNDLFGGGDGEDGEDGEDGDGGDDGGISGAFDAVGDGMDAVGKGLDVLRCLSPLANPCIAGGGIGASQLKGGLVRTSSRAGRDVNQFGKMAPLLERAEQSARFFGFYTNLLGDEVWVHATNRTVRSNWFSAYRGTLTTNSDGGNRITAAERANLLAVPIPGPATTNDAHRLLDRWNRTIDYHTAGIKYLTNVPAGQSTDFIAIDERSRSFQAAKEVYFAIRAEGFRDIVEAYNTTRSETIELLGRQSDGVCAKVKLCLAQEAVLTRDGFLATLEIENNTDTPLEEVFAELKMENDSGELTTALFQIRPPELSNVTAIDGAGIIPASVIARSAWTIVPSSQAAPTESTAHFVYGTLRYRQNGTLVTLPLERTLITVLPSPRLVLDYFHERDVFSDDPFTPETEPAIPYSLAVRVRNEGFGSANNFRITSAQPVIVENEKGLFINFEIIATEVSGVGLTPALTANFGDIGANQIKVGRWIFQSSLQGLFTDYSATFEHVSGLGDKRFSLIDRVDIHEMIHLVQADRTFEDGLPDFLANDVPDLRDYPDTLHFSHGSNAPVVVVTNGTTDAPISTSDLTAQLTASVPSGWVYLRLPDPADPTFQLREVRRADNSLVPLTTNVWRTDRTFIGFGQRPLRENILHLLDFNSSGSYTLVYESLNPAADITPPVSSVAALPTASPLEFSVNWSGEDETNGSGIAYFDIFVSVNGGAFTNWLRSSSAGAIFNGTSGDAFAFFSRATDAAGNTEAAPAVADTQTSATLINTPPSLSLGPDLAVNEGATVTIQASATDTNIPAQVLTFALLSAPPGVTLNAQTGGINFPTGEGSGPSTNVITVRVTDNGSPALSVTNSVAVVVREVNQAPNLALIADFIIPESSNLVVSVTATDSDLPANALTFALGSGAPAGATITPSGLFSWRPNSAQGPTTNRIKLIVIDNGAPSLSATQSIVVVVRNTRPDFTVSIGSTNLFIGQSNWVPVVLNSGVELTELTFDLNLASPLIEELALNFFAPQVISASLIALNADESQLQFGLTGVALDVDHTLAQLEFITSTNGSSALIPLPLANAIGAAPDATLYTNVALGFGRIIVVNQEPVLEMERTPFPALVVFGLPLEGYRLETTTNLISPVWQPAMNFNLTESFHRIALPDMEESTLFYRVVLPSN